MNWLDWIILIFLTCWLLDGLRKGDGCLGSIIKGAISLLLGAIVAGALLWGIQWFNTKYPVLFPETMQQSYFVGRLNSLLDEL